MRRLSNRSVILAISAGLASPALAQSLSTGFTGTGVVSTTAANTGNMFDLTCFAPEGITITSLDVNSRADLGTPLTVQVYTRPGSFVGFESDPNAWTLHGTANTIAAGGGQPTPVLLPNLFIPGNQTQGMYVNIVEAGASVRYYTATTIPPDPSNSHLAIHISYGNAKSGLFGSTFTPRGWNGTVHYVVGQPQPGACCLPSGACAMLLPNDCLAQGGAYNGPGVQCAGITCPQPGACCLTDGTCASILQAPCLDQGGLWRGAGVPCTSANCPTGVWQVIAPAPEARSRVAGTIVGNFFYYLGGEATGAALNTTAWKLDLTSHQWSPIAPLPPVPAGSGGVSNVAAAAIGTDIYLPGGWDGIAAVSRLLKYDTITDTWDQVFTDPPPVPVYSNGAAVVGGKLYVIGGNQVGTNLVYDPSGQIGERWSTIPAPPSAHAYPAVAVIDNKIYVTGNGSAATTAVHIYDPATNSWTAAPSLNEVRGGGALFNVAGTPTAVSGGWTTYLRSAERLSGGAWERILGVNSGVRTFAYAGNDQVLVKAGGWNGGFTAATEIFTLSGGCYANCDGSTTQPILNVADFTCFLTKFAASDPYANCDGSTTPPVHNIADFTCFLTKFAAGC
jgi:hypothetical protein